MIYYSTKKGCGPFHEKWWQKLILGLLFFIPKANHDFDKKYTDVRLWWIEINELGWPEREIGFNEDNEPIVVGPIGDNYGFWTDTNESLKLDDFELIDGSLFKSAWYKFEQKWNSRRHFLHHLIRKSLMKDSR